MPFLPQISKVCCWHTSVKIQPAYEATISNVHTKHFNFILQSFVINTLGFLMNEKKGPITHSYVICTRLHVADRQAMITVSTCLEREEWGGWTGMIMWLEAELHHHTLRSGVRKAGACLRWLVCAFFPSNCQSCSALSHPHISVASLNTADRHPPQLCVFVF